MAAEARSTTSARPRVVLGVGGGIAAYKACELLRRLAESGHDVTVVPTASALRFVGAPTWEALSGHPVSAEVWESVSEVPHVRLGQQADLVVVAPATADLLARAAHGLADDLLTNTLLTARCPVLFAPAMHTEMWQHPATRENVAALRRRGAVVLDPAVGRLTGADSGPGRLPEPQEIFEAALGLLRRGCAAPDLAGLRVLITAGGTREPLDPVRYLGNRSSGMQGYALARAAVARGAEVTLIAANVALPDPAGVKMLRAGTALELRDEVRAAAAEADVVVMSAAVADFRPADYADAKIKKADDSSAPELRLVQNPHILREIGHERLRPGQTVVGFAAETGDAEHSALELGRRKLAKYGVDLLVVNEVGVDKVFGRPETEAVILDAAGDEAAVPPGPKSALAEEIWNRVAAWRARG
ncbi:bifunctional phosphopantothenoylcysteine decarboxylase/phosphopantothenate--cysteine ligase CoaBC [Actinospica sp. MGRD01-02]|uniref:Coenzyme A biosynthesis bifunctional protein CoaBC n=1 Tax=Actinospica acidithermotolerans TaxID=2828514 RepID=A0A941EHE5_9ACTN|nr:bifunctional phosphopantothenoylcysteine decarboxylase/phosphopantothenate--cysteine ligase CoaBC [Actinospica acidithermotolerans]MBR7830557.1 bifunctional phosphopantothenoylcysteine decarboxylase/phosphopantothenate--cysteine ligase CoaBC [Actinospica acidithermotolerans]